WSNSTFGGEVLLVGSNVLSTASPTFRPSAWPATLENWKSVPAKMPLRPASCAAWLKLVKLRVAPDADIAEKATFWPKKLPRMSAAVALIEAWVSTYSGSSGVFKSGVKFGSEVFWTALTGLQRSKLYLAFHVA